MNIVDRCIQIFSDYHVYLYMLIVHILFAIPMYLRQVVWDKTSKSGKFKIIETKLYKDASKKSYYIPMSHYPLVISQIETPSGNRYMMLNKTQRAKVLCNNRSSVKVFHDRYYNLLTEKNISRMTKVGLMLNVVGYYISWVLLFSILHFILGKFSYEYQFVIDLLVCLFTLYCSLKYLVTDFIFFNLKLKYYFFKSKETFDLKKREK